VICVRCRRGEAAIRRRLLTSAATLGLPEVVCLVCARELDEVAEKCARGVAQVERAVTRHRGGTRERLSAEGLARLLEVAA
jgi:hypothetical protein